MSDSKNIETARESGRLDPGFPQARIVDEPALTFGLTRLWWLAVACLLLAIGLVVWSMPPAGTYISIAFPEGHGLKAEDPVRYRGIDVGMVESVHLTAAMDSVDVHVNLLPSAKQLAVEGSRFWIVRPQLSISGVSGLETAVGHKYIEVVPGPADAMPIKVFEGLSQAPADTATANGIEILLQADARYSVNRGSAIHYRGVDIGRVLAVELSPDSRYVEVRGKIDEAYRALVTTESRFWATGGVDVDFSLREGLKLETESLDTLARGGVSMMVVGNGKPVAPGHVFSLEKSVNEDWLVQGDKFRTTTADMRGCVNLEVTWKEKMLFRNWKKSERFSGIAIRNGDGQQGVVIPTDVLKLQERATEDSFVISLITADGSRMPVDCSNLSMDEPVGTLAIEGDKDLISTENVASSHAPAPALVVRKSAESQMYLHLPIAESDIGVVQDGDVELWRLSNFSGDRAVWHGCPVLLAADSSLVGMLLVDDKGPRVYLMK